MDTDTFLWESDYFAQHCVTKFFAKEELLTSAWEEERKRMAARAAGFPKVNMHRDFQSENIMIRRGRVRFIDFQGARLGPAHYDAASLIFDPYIDQLGPGSVEGLINYYLAKKGASSDSDKNDFYVCAAQRLMQALGAYGNLSIHKGKPQYRQFIPIAIERLAYVFNNFLPDYPAMRELVNGCK
jgi:aminoglycoside/choline kinase family phosphotransferase